MFRAQGYGMDAAFKLRRVCCCSNQDRTKTITTRRLTMRKLSVFGILLALALFLAVPAMACEITCAGGSCSSAKGDCHCDGDSPHCIDSVETITQDYVQYLETWKTPGLNRVADAAAKLLDASNANDLEGYLAATKVYNEALQKLTKADRQIVSAWEEKTHPPVSGR